MAAQEDALDDEDRTALTAYYLLNRPVIQRLHLQGLVFDGLGLTMTRRHVLDFIERLSVIEQDEAERQQEPEDVTAKP